MLASPTFCEYGGTQTNPENDGRPVDMPPMVSASIGGIRPCLTMVLKYDSMPLFCKMAIHTSFEKVTMFGRPPDKAARCCVSLTDNHAVRQP